MTHLRATLLAATALSCALVVPAYAASDATPYRVSTSDPNVDQLCFYLPGSGTARCDELVNKTTGARTRTTAQTMSSTLAALNGVGIGTNDGLIYQSDSSGSVGIRTGTGGSDNYFGFGANGTLSVPNGGVSAARVTLSASGSTGDVSSMSVATPYVGTPPSLATAAKARCLTPYDFGAVGDDVADDAVPLANWASAMTSAPSHKMPCLALGQGIFRSSTDFIINMPANSVGPVIRGNGGYNSTIALDAGHRMGIYSTTAMFYSHLEDFAVTGSYAGPLLELSTYGSVNDAINGATITQVVANNTSPSASNEGIRVNALYNSRFLATANCSGHGNGNGIEFIAGTMNSIKGSAGSCFGGFLFSSGSQTFSGNTFDAIDSEVNSVQVRITGSAVRGNFFSGGILSYLYGGTSTATLTSGSTTLTSVSPIANIAVGQAISGSGIPAGDTVASVTPASAGATTGSITLVTAPTASATETVTLANDVGIDATAGSGNIFKSFIYGGFGTLFSVNKVGVVWENTIQDLVYPGPAVPAATVAATNTSGQPVLAQISGGTVTSVVVDGLNICLGTPCSPVIMPGSSIYWTGSAAPQWIWRAVAF